MKLNLKDEPKEWRKSAQLGALGLALTVLVLHWSRWLESGWACGILLWLLVVVVAASIKPHWFRGYHLFSMRLGFAFSRVLGKFLLRAFFVLLITPMGFVLRWLGKDLLGLKRPDATETYWRKPAAKGSLERLF